MPLLRGLPGKSIFGIAFPPTKYRMSNLTATGNELMLKSGNVKKYTITDLTGNWN